ncbi:MAG TPA: hypothetical protein DCY88_31800 [Cyanobacteria bacterium UBA11372]|nr:hypothetical protein [Cyanobacteria bacterium UBA11372]
MPKTYHIVVEVVYEAREATGYNHDYEAKAGIDIGLNNLATITSNQKGFRPVIVNGRPLKSINAIFTWIAA